MLSKVADEAREDAKGQLVEEIAVFVEAGASDRAEGDRLPFMKCVTRAAAFHMSTLEILAGLNGGWTLLSASFPFRGVS